MAGRQSLSGSCVSYACQSASAITRCIRIPNFDIQHLDLKQESLYRPVSDRLVWRKGGKKKREKQNKPRKRKYPFAVKCAWSNCLRAIQSHFFPLARRTKWTVSVFTISKVFAMSKMQLANEFTSASFSRPPFNCSENNLHSDGRIVYG